MTEREAKAFLNNLKVCIEEHPIVADWLVEIADRKTENSSENPNNCEDEFFREPTAEERKAVADYIDSISVPTGVNVFDLMDEPQIVDWGKRKPCTLELFDDDGNYIEPKDEPQTENPCDGCVCDDGKHLMYCMNCKGIAWKTEPPKVEDEPQTDCYVSDLCKHYGDKQICGRCRSRNLFCEAEPQPRCPKCGKRGYIRSLESMGVKLKVFDEYKWKCTNCNKYFKEEPKDEPQTERSK